MSKPMKATQMGDSISQVCVLGALAVIMLFVLVVKVRCVPRFGVEQDVTTALLKLELWIISLGPLLVRGSVSGARRK